MQVVDPRSSEINIFFPLVDINLFASIFLEVYKNQFWHLFTNEDFHQNTAQFEGLVRMRGNSSDQCDRDLFP